MYIPNHFKGNENSVFEFVQTYPFGLISSLEKERISATHLPFVIEKEGDKLFLYSHLAKANPHWKSFKKKEVLLVFSEPHAYISPRNYTAQQNVPTWNYLAAHFYGKATVFENEVDNLNILEKMIHVFEADYISQWESLNEKYKSALLNEIVGFKVEVSEILFKEKLSQNKSKKERSKIKQVLEESPDSSENSLASYMS